MRVVFCGGGTGGHVYPALTVAAALQRRYAGSEPLDLLYVGVRGKMDRDLVSRTGIAFEDVTAGPVRSSSKAGTAKGLLKLSRGVAESYRILKRFRPDVVFATGGYGSVGVGLAARLARLPLLVFLPDVEAGLAVRQLVRVATCIAVTVSPAEAAMPAGKTVLTGYPVRPAFFEARREEARERLGLQPELPVLLVSGASSGANRLNTAIAGWAEEFLRRGQLLHICGPTDEAWLRERRNQMAPELRERYHLYAYLHEDMAQALAAADLAVMRSGASTLGELPAAGLPAVLVPGEYEGWDQSPNARYLEGEGAAVMLPQSRLDELQTVVTGLFSDDARRAAMKQALARLARPDAADRLAGVIAEMAGARQGVAA